MQTALFTDDEAAAAIQSRIRGRHARAQTSHRAAQRASARIDDEPSIPFTTDLAKQLAEAGGVGASARRTTKYSGCSAYSIERRTAGAAAAAPT